MPELKFRGFELHSKFVWDMDWVVRGLNFARDHGMTALVLHRNDIVDRVVFPTRYFGGTGTYENIHERYADIHRALYKYTPTRRSGPYQRRDYLKRIIDLGARANIEIWFENKELFFHEIILEFQPQLVKNGPICPNEPFWWEFVETKYTELFEELPGLAGIICAPGTGESKVAISVNRCTCELCKATTMAEWYTRLVGAMHKPIHAAGKQLVIRDFVHHRAVHNELGAAIEALPPDVIVSLKNTPHDYFPTFPDNPRLGHVGNHRQWLEFDCMGQYFGWGISPAIMIEDIRDRLTRGVAAGVEGATFRTDWESLDGHNAMRTPNLINVYAGAALSRNQKAEALPMYQAWLTEQGMIRPDATPAQVRDAAKWAESLLGKSWDITRLASYARDYVMNDSTCYPVSFKVAWWLTDEKLSLEEWDASRAGRLIPTEENTRLMLAEKDEALKKVEALQAIVDAPPAALTKAAGEDLVRRHDIFRRYVKGFRAVGRALMLARFVLAHDREDPFFREAETLLQHEMAALLEIGREFDDFAAGTDYHYTVYTLLSGERLRVLHEDLRREIGERTPRVAAAS